MFICDAQTRRIQDCVLRLKRINLVLAPAYKQVWFVVLMAWVMGWSSIVSAAVKPTHVWMMSSHTQITETQSAVSAASANPPLSSLSDCHSVASKNSVDIQHASLEDRHSRSHAVAQLDASAAHLSSNNTNNPDCVSATDFSAASMNCQDCAQLHCQSLSTVLNVQLPELMQPAEHTPANILLPAYKAQHLLGHWQQILRPPKA